MSPLHRVQALAEDLLGRPLTAQDGVMSESIVTAERALGRSLPAPLATFYRLVGKLPQFTDAFDNFYALAELCDDEGLLMFLDENQVACSWGVDAQGRVFQCQDDDRYDEGLDLQAFLELIMQYQVATGGNYGYDVGIPDDELADLLTRDGWQETVNHNQLVIHRLHGFLIWFFQDADGKVKDNLRSFSSLIAPPDVMIQRYCLVDTYPAPVTWQELANDPSSKLAAIKVYKTLHGVGLKAAKKAVDAYITDRSSQS
jgi:hypothetical protein